MSKGKILFVLTSRGVLLDGHHTGFYLPEAAHPYYVVKQAGYEIDWASPNGGVSPLDPDSVAAFKDEQSVKFLEEGKKFYEHTKKLSEVNHADYKAILYVGGHGPVIDLAVDWDSIKLIQDFWNNNKIVSAVCHGPAVFAYARDASGKLIVNGKRVTCFSNAEEEAVQKCDAIPFLPETKLKEAGAKYETTETLWEPYVVTDGNLITGRNPASAEPFAHAVVKALEGK